MTAVLINTSAEALDVTELMSPRRRLIQTSATTQLAFHCDSTFGFGVQKSTDSNATWGAFTQLGDGTFSEVLTDIYRKTWTSSGFADKVDLYRWDDAGGTRGLYHSQYTLSDDTFTASTLAVSLGAASAPVGGGICVARSGRIYITGGGAGLSAASMAYSDDEGATWIPTGNAIADGNGVNCEMWPDFSSANTNAILAIYGVNTGSGLQTRLEVRQFNPTTGSITNTTIATPLTGAAGFGHLGLATTMDASGTVYVACMDTHDVPADGDTVTIKTWTVVGSTVTARANVVDAPYVCGVALAITSTNRIFCFYGKDNGAASGSSLEIYYQYSDDFMQSWSAEQTYGTRSGDVTSIVADPRPTGLAISPGWFEGASDDLWIEAPPVTVPSTTPPIPPIVFKCMDGVDGVGVVPFTADGIDVFRCIDVDGPAVIGFTVDSYPLVRAS